MTDFYKKYDVIVVKFPFASRVVYKARPAVIISSNFYNQQRRNTVFVLAISSQTDSKLDFELPIVHGKAAGLLTPSIFKASIATIDQSTIIAKLGTLAQADKEHLDNLIQKII